MYAFAVHVVDGVAAATAYADDFDDAVVGLWEVYEGESHIEIYILMFV